VALLKVVPGPVPSQLGKSSDHYRALKVKSFPHLHFHNSHCCFFTQPAYQGSSKPSSGSSGAVTSALYFISRTLEVPTGHRNTSGTMVGDPGTQRVLLPQSSQMQSFTFTPNNFGQRENQKSALPRYFLDIPTNNF